MQTAETTAQFHPIADLIPLLRLEGLAIGLAAIAAYAELEQGWVLFAVLLLAPDLAMAGYALGPRAGAIAYNAAHSYFGPALLAGAAWLAGWPMGLALAAIWTAHIGLDRAIGYGLKHRSGFEATHLTAPVPR